MAILHNRYARIGGMVFGTLLLMGIALYLLRNHLPFPFFGQGVVIEEKLIIPNTIAIGGHSGRAVAPGAYTAPIDPTATTRVISSRAIYTIQQAHTAVVDRARLWSPDAALISIQSLGVITEEGKSGEWQLFFGSETKNAGLELIVYGNEVVGEKQVPSASVGYALPNDWYDSGDALISLRDMPQFKDATVSSLNFFYNEDGERWGYALSTSRGTVSMPVR